MGKNHEVHLAARTVRKRVEHTGLNGRIAAKKPLLRPYNIAKKRAFAKMYKTWTVVQLNKVLWNDESTFTVFCGAKRAYVRRRVGK